MEIVAPIVGLIVLILAAAWIRAKGISAQVDHQKGKDTEAALETTRRIEDATRLPPDTDDARDWLREFGDDASSRKR